MLDYDFESLTKFDFGRALYRGCIGFAMVFAIRTIQIDRGTGKALAYLEKELWRPSKCTWQMGMITRYFYTSITSSMLCYLVRKGYILYAGKQSEVRYLDNIGMGAFTGTLLTGHALSTSRNHLIAGAVIGSLYSVLYVFTCKSFMEQQKLKVKEVSPEYDTNFSLSEYVDKKDRS